jgi:hypothetical protein
MVKAKWRRPWLVFALPAGLLCVTACGVDLNTNLMAPTLVVRVGFSDYHANVAGTWTGTLTARSPDVPPGLVANGGPAQASLAAMPDVRPTEQADFPAVPSMYPGEWALTVTVTSDAGPLISVSCPVTIPSTLRAGVGVSLTLEVQEGSNQCTSPDIAVGEPHVPRRDVQILPFTAPVAVDQGDPVTLQIVVRNAGEAQDTFSVGLVDTPPSSGSPGVVTPAAQAVSSLPASASSPPLSFAWNTAGASIGPHQLTASASVPNDADPSNNRSVATVEVKTPPVHDLEVTSVASGGPLILGGSYPVTVGVKNNGDVGETIRIDLLDSPPTGPEIALGTSSSLALAASGQANDAASYTFTWSTGGAAPGVHTLRGKVAPVPHEASTLNNEKTATVTLEQHDVQAVSVSAPAATNVGLPVSATATIRNNGNVDESAVSLALTALAPDGTTIALGTQSVSLATGQSLAVPFTWDTSCVAAGGYRLGARVAVPNDSNPANDSASAGPTTLSVDHELSISLVSPPPTVTAGGGVGLIVRLVNNNSIAEANVDVNMTDTPASGPPGAIQKDPRLPVSPRCGETIDLVFTWFPPSAFTGSHQLTVSIVNAIAGDDPGDNSSSATIVVQ